MYSFPATKAIVNCSCSLCSIKQNTQRKKYDCDNHNRDILLNVLLNIVSMFMFIVVPQTYYGGKKIGKNVHTERKIKLQNRQRF